MRSKTTVLAAMLFLAGCSCSETEAGPTGDVGPSSRSDGSLADSGRGGGDGAPSSPRCARPPGRDFDPLPSYRPPTLVPTHTVTTADDSGPGSLRDVVASAPEGAVVGFDPSLAGQTIALASVIEIPVGMTIDGSAAPGITLDGQGSSRIFGLNRDAPTRLAFFSLRFIRGFSAGTGSAIAINGREIDFEIGGCLFEDNVGGEGGAIRTGYGYWGTTISIHDSVFRRNDGSAGMEGGRPGFSGGAISTIGGQVHVVRVRFEDNVGSITGALYTLHSYPLVEDSVFVGNRTSGDGGTGAFFADGGKARADDAPTPGRIAFARTLFEGNSGGGTDGGAVMAYGYEDDHISFDSVVIKDNVSTGRAGAAHIHNRATARILRSAIVGNRAASLGGAIWADGGGDFEIENSLFSGNSTDSDFGGALRMNIPDTSSVRITSSTFVDNVASVGAGVLWLPGADMDVRVRNSMFVSNRQSWVAQINFPVIDDGGNLVWPAPDSNSNPFLVAASVADPGLGALEEMDGTWVRAPAAGGPAIDQGVAPAVEDDQRGAPRGAAPDIGALELGASCAP